VRGPHRKTVRFKPLTVSPNMLQVEVGPTTEVPGGMVTQTLMKIRIPKGSPPADHLGSEQGRLGRITLETNHPSAPQLQVLVRFAIKG